MFDSLDAIIQRLYAEIHSAERRAHSADLAEDFAGQCSEMGYVAGLRFAIDLMSDLLRNCD